MITLTDLCTELHNWFTWPEDKHHGIALDTLPELDILQGQYYRIVGSVFNDGVYQNTDEPHEWTYEETKFSVWVMRVPDQVIKLLEQINTWQEKYGKAVSGPYQSESFDGYSRTLRSGSTGSGTWSWQEQFRSQLNNWRKI